ELEFVGASIESRADNRTGRIYANFLTKDMDLVLDILADLLVNPAFDPDKIELRKKTLIEGIRRKADDPRSLGRREFSKLIYRDHPAGREPTEETITNITRQDVVAFHNNYVRPNNAVIGIAGDITKEEALARLNRAFADWQPGGTRPVFPAMAYELNPSVNYIYKDVNQAYIFAGHMAMNSSNPDRPIATIMNYILGGGSFTSWITQRIRSDEGLAYHASSRYSPAPWGYGVFVATCQTRTDAAMRALELLIEQIERMKTEGPTEQEVEDAKQALLNRQVFEYESPGRLVSRLIWYDLVGLPLDTLEKDFEAYQKTTVEDVRRVAHKYLHPEALTILVVGDQSKFDRPLSDFGIVNEIEIEKEVETQ
ncbi:MAG TPA: insulinase family protein, partial [Firmicutes bacterium]|nr:insulinase family protein [Bacillota bacterium]